MSEAEPQAVAPTEGMVTTTIPCNHSYGRRVGVDGPRKCLKCGEALAPWVRPKQNNPVALMVQEPPSDELGRYGPAMAALSERQRAFVSNLLEIGDGNASRALRETGLYLGDPNGTGCRVAAWKLQHDAKIQAAMQEEGQRRINTAGPMAIVKLLQIINDTETDETGRPHVATKDKLKAIELVLNRSGLHAKTEHKVTVELTTDEEMVARIKTLSGQLGLDPKQLLGSAGIIDAEFEEVK